MTSGADRCPRCEAPRGEGQDYCLACGLRLPDDTGALARARRIWVRRLGWYPGEWIWAALLALLVAAGGAALAVVATHDASSASGGSTLYLTADSVPLAEPTTAATPSPAATGTLPRPPEPTGSGGASRPPAETAGATAWPVDRSGWTVVLEAVPANETGRKQASARAGRAVKDGLPEVGVLVSDRYSTLHPGYYVVFSGIYDTRAEAESNLRAAVTAGFSGAYARQITR